MAVPIVILADNPSALVELCGISTLERLLRTLQRCGVERATVLSSTPEAIEQALAQPSWARAGLDLTVRSRTAGPVTIEQVVDSWPEGAELLLVVPADVVCDSRLLRLLISQNQSTVLVDSAPPRFQRLVASAPATKDGRLCGPVLVSRGWARGQTGTLKEVLREGLEQQTLAALDVAAQPFGYSPMKRKRISYWFPVPSPDGVKLAERVLLDAAQKGPLDLPALVHGPIESFLVSRLCRTSITPNQLTILTNIVAWIATVLFVTGHIVAGIVIALMVGVLDGLDGRQARVKVETTKSGKLEHWFDAMFEWSWWIALAYQFQISGQLPGAFWYLALLAAAEAVDGILKGIVYFRTGKVIDELGTFEQILRLVGGRRNVYVWILAIGLLLGAPGKAFAMMAWLEVFTAAAHLSRVAWVFARGSLVRAD